MKLSEYKNIEHGVEHEIYFRPAPSSDFAVITQIFHQKVYALDGWLHKGLLEKYYLKQFNAQKPLIIDAGANIGASSIFFADTWENSLVIGIEPEKHNFALLKLNALEKSILSLEGALGSESGKMYLSDPGHGDVGFRVANTGAYEVNVYSVKEIIATAAEQDAAPFIIKIDIEGGESQLFSANTEWMNEFALIIIELHDWMLPMQGSSKPFFKAISNLDFEILQKGENLFFFNRALLA